MAETPPQLTHGFDPENTARIYHGEPALVNGQLPADILGELQFRAASCAADGFTIVEVAQTLGMSSIKSARLNLQSARGRLGTLDNFQLAGYFPMDPDHEAIGDKKLADLADLPHALSILEAISVGKRNRQVLAQEDIGSRALRSCMSDMEAIWENIEGGLMMTRVANAIRARYVRAIEARPGTINPRHVPLLTLPALAKLEPRIEHEFMGNGRPLSGAGHPG